MFKADNSPTGSIDLYGSVSISTVLARKERFKADHSPTGSLDLYGSVSISTVLTRKQRFKTDHSQFFYSS